MSETSWLTDDQLTFVVGSMLVHEVIFWTYGLVFWLIRKNKWFEEYRLGEEPPSPLVRGLMKEVCLSHFVTQPISLWVLFYVAKASGMKFELEFDSLSSTLKGVAVAMLWEDFFLYWGHRLLHQPPLYKWFHKKHHEFKTNIPAVSEYATITEIMLDNVWPTVVGGFVATRLFEWHVISFWIWLGIRVSESCDSHCGYQLPFSPWCLFPDIQGGAARHEYHHSHNIGNFGSFFVFWDWLCGTDVAWKKFRNEQQKKQQAKTKAK